MIERLKASGGWAFGFKVTGKVTEEDIKAFEPQLSFAIAERKKRPLGILADNSEMDSIDLSARGKNCAPAPVLRPHRPGRAGWRQAVGRSRLDLHRWDCAFRRCDALLPPF